MWRGSLHHWQDPILSHFVSSHSIPAVFPSNDLDFLFFFIIILFASFLFLFKFFFSKRINLGGKVWRNKFILYPCTKSPPYSEMPCWTLFSSLLLYLCKSIFMGGHQPLDDFRHTAKKKDDVDLILSLFLFYFLCRSRRWIRVRVCRNLHPPRVKKGGGHLVVLTVSFLFNIFGRTDAGKWKGARHTWRSHAPHPHASTRQTKQPKFAYTDFV